MYAVEIFEDHVVSKFTLNVVFLQDAVFKALAKTTVTRCLLTTSKEDIKSYILNSIKH
jgi:sulfur transfer complex TusBCD TusB component (DsrH family)